ncbi:hypothetical protein [Nostoc sp.]|uniref:hypothetical protein n=1 Tax=Nostoc sp. TaxID=1180 RepID=UPI002FF4890D
MSLAIRRDFAIKAILQLDLVVLEGSYVEGISKEGEWGMVKTVLCPAMLTPLMGEIILILKSCSWGNPHDQTFRCVMGKVKSYKGVVAA